MNVQIMISITVYMLGMLLIGYYSYRKTSNLSDYVLGGRNLGPAVTALSAGASDMSGWLLMGLPGAMYSQGLSAAWIVVGLTLGAYANWLYVAPRLRTFTEAANNSMTIPSYLENRFGDRSRVLRLVSALVIIIFFTIYISSGMVSGGVLFQSVFGLDYQVGLWIIALVVLSYTFFGGFLAVSLTDFVQGVIMFVALILVPMVTVMQVGGITPAVNIIESVNPQLFDIFRGTSVMGMISLMAWGLGYFGQPHIIVRFMAIASVKDIKKARRIGMGWMIISVMGAVLTGLVGIAYYTQNGLVLADPETIFIQLGRMLFHPLITGFLLAALLAAVMSTISSQLLVTSSSLTEDLYRMFFRRTATDRELTMISRLSVLVVCIVAILMSYNKNGSILDIVGYAWAGFGAAFGPVILLSLYWKRMTRWGALSGMVIGAVTVLIWSNIPMLADTLYEIIPGFGLSMLAVYVVSLLTAAPDEAADIIDQYNK